MPIIHDCVQGTSEWAMLRAGIPTASEFSRILTPTGKPSKSAEPYMYDLLAERLMGVPLIQFNSAWMQRGKEMEEEAVAFFELQRDCNTQKIGFITTDDGRIGASPDRGIDSDGLLEIKVPSPGVHLGYLLNKPVDSDYYPQIMGQLWVSGRSYLEILSYHPKMPPALIRVERDEDYIGKLATAVTAFSEKLEEHAERLKERGWIPDQPATVVDIPGFSVKPLAPLDELVRQAQEAGHRP